MISSKKKKVLSAFLSLTMIGSMVAAVPFTASAATAGSVSYSIYENKAWHSGSDGAAVGNANKGYRVEAFKASSSDVSLTYKVYENKAWHSGSDGAAVGNANKGYTVEALGITSNDPNYDVSYSVYENKAWHSGSDGALVGNANKGYAVEALKVTVTAKKPAAATVTSIAPVDVTTTVGTAPVLPATVTATMNDGTTKDEAVTWDTVDPTSYAKAGTFAVSGTIADSTTVKATANVTVSGASIKSTTATGAKIVTVAFNGPVDTTKASFSVKKGSVAVNVASVKFSDDKTSAALTLASNLTAGDYTITVSGLTDTALTSTLKAEDQQLAKITFASETASLVRGADGTVNADEITVSYNAFNQYNEDITANTSVGGTTGLQFTASKGTVTANPSTGVLTITSATAYNSGDKVSLSVIDPSTSTYASTVLTVGVAAQVSDITISALVNTNTANPSEILNTAATPGDFKLVIDAKDQYGNEVPAADIAADTILTVSNPAVVGVAGGSSTPTYSAITVNGVTNTTTLALAGTLTAGTATISIISKTTGHKATYTVTVLDTAKVDTLSMSAPDLAVAGENVNVPFTAVDQFGNAVTSLSGLTIGAGDSITSLTSTIGTPSFQMDYVNNKVNLVLNLHGVTTATPETAVITAITGTSKVQQVSISVQPNAKPVVITGTKNFTPNFAVTATEPFTAANVVFNDQYGRPIVPTIGTGTGDYQVAVASSNTDAVALDNSALDGTVNTINFAAAAAKGSSTITLTLEDHTGAVVANSEYTFNSTVVDKAGIASYDLADFANLEAVSDATHEVAVTVTGTTADGTKVIVPQSFYSVVTNDTYVTYDSAANKLTSDTGYTWGTATSRTVPVVVTVLGDTAPVVLTKNVTVVNADPSVAAIALNTNSANYVSDGVVTATAADVNADLNAVVASVVSVTDQFGVAYDAATALTGATIIPSNISNSHTIGTVAAGDTFNVTVITSNSKVLTFKVIVD